MKLRPILLGLLSAALITLAVPNEIFHFGNPLFGAVALVPLFIALSISESKRETRIIVVVFAVVSSLATYFWLAFFLSFSVWTITGVTAGHVFYFLAINPALFLLSRRSEPYRPVLLALLWTGYEFIKSIGYIGFPWGLLAYPVGDIIPLMQISDIAGLWAVSFLVALVNAVAAETVLRYIEPAADIGGVRRYQSTVRLWAFTAALIAGCLIYGYIALSRSDSESETASMNIVMVQQNLDPWEGGNDQVSLQRAQDLTRSALEAATSRTDIVLWSESSLRYPFIESYGYYARSPKGDPFTDFLVEIDTPILLGGPYVIDMDRGKAMNAALLIDGENGVVRYYGKHHPVPFAEHIPFYEFDVVENFFREVVGLPAIWTMGEEYTIFEIPVQDGGSVRFGVPICFEDSFPSIGRRFTLAGAQILVNITNDSWSKTISAETQHFAAARYRAVENRRTLVRSSNSGVTAVVDRYGRVRAMLPLFTEDYYHGAVEVQRGGSYTPYTLFGDYLPILIWIGLFVYIASKKKSRSGVIRRAAPILSDE